ncbi:Hypothetical protein NTJ_03407 [Nesidiocoris tenuis]|uniref:Uncharacterized protein n=1 Tax=Nesidiocoris tenuis TaxID=355587 RepID=A0ABN7AHB3_9HEMI|nr:Hypothetical protein NTJ_03407 [Nesidiocoris tenuis]
MELVSFKIEPASALVSSKGSGDREPHSAFSWPPAAARLMRSSLNPRPVPISSLRPYRGTADPAATLFIRSCIS